MKKHYIKHSLNSIQTIIIESNMSENDMRKAFELLKEIRLELDKDDDK